MISVKEKYIVDENGERISVMLDMKEYEKMLRELEELESIRVYDAAKASGEPKIPFSQAVDEIEKERK